MKKAEAEKTIRNLCHVWAKVRSIPPSPIDQPSFSDFKTWLNKNGYWHDLKFRSLDPDGDAERWFDQEFK